MTEEEYFRKNHPDSCYGDKPLSPYWDFFQDGVEFAERQSEKKIAELEKDKAYAEEQLDEQIQATLKLQKENAELEETIANLKEQVQSQVEATIELDKKLAQAKEIIKKLYSHVFQGMDFMELNDFNFLKAESEQFLKDVP